MLWCFFFTLDKKETLPTVALFGNSTSVQFGHNNILLGEKTPPLKHVEFSRIVPVQIKISERHVSVINMIDITELPMDFVDHLIGQVVQKKEIDAFIYVMQLAQLTHADKGLEWLQTVFGEGVLQFVMIVFTYDREEESDTIIDDLKRNPAVEELLKKCGERYHTCSSVMNNQSEMRELMKKIDHLVHRNKEQCYTREMYKMQLKKRSHSQKNENKSGKKCFFSHSFMFTFFWVGLFVCLHFCSHSHSIISFLLLHGFIIQKCVWWAWIFCYFGEFLRLFNFQNNFV